MSWQAFQIALCVVAILGFCLSMPATRAQVADASSRCGQKNGLTTDQQIAACTVVIQSGGEFPTMLLEALMSRASAYVIKGYYDNAIHDYDRALSLDNQHALAFNNRG